MDWICPGCHYAVNNTKDYCLKCTIGRPLRNPHDHSLSDLKNVCDMLYKRVIALEAKVKKLEEQY